MHLCTFFYIFPWGGNRTKPCACHLLLPSATTPVSMAQQAEPELLLPLHPSGIRDVPGELRHPWPQPSSSKGGAPHPTAARSLMGWAGTRSRAEETRHDDLIYWEGSRERWVLLSRPSDVSAPGGRGPCSLSTLLCRLPGKGWGCAEVPRTEDAFRRSSYSLSVDVRA